MLYGTLNDDVSLGKGKFNIICVDLNPNLLRALLSFDNIFIPVILIRSYFPSIIYLLKKYRHCFGRILAMYPENYDQFFEMLQTDHDLSFYEIEKFKFSQFYVERFMNRHVNDLNEIDYRYLHYLAFWLGIFDKYKISCVLSDRIFHGDLNDGLLYNIAKDNNIPSYIFDVEFANLKMTAKSLVRVFSNDVTHLETAEKNCIDMSKYLFYYRNDIDSKDEYTDENFIINQHNMYTYQFNKMSNIAKLKFLTDGYMSWDNMNPEQITISYNYVKLLCEIYDAIAEDINENENFVYYALHFEPEASILNRAELSNQLYIIKTIAQSLPSGWKVYVKEHPCQLRYNRKDLFSYFNNINYYRSFQFYAQLKRIQNVRILRKDIDSEILIKKAKAIATINGTVSLEAVFHKKPLLLFSKRTQILSYLNNAFIISRKSDVKKALSLVEKGFSPIYDDFENIISRYMMIEYEYDSGDIIHDQVVKYKKILSIIFNDIKSLNCSC